jgi:hypothetical protein
MAAEGRGGRGQGGHGRRPMGCGGSGEQATAGGGGYGQRPRGCGGGGQGGRRAAGGGCGGRGRGCSETAARASTRRRPMVFGNRSRSVGEAADGVRETAAGESKRLRPAGCTRLRARLLGSPGRGSSRGQRVTPRPGRGCSRGERVTPRPGRGCSRGERVTPRPGRVPAHLRLGRPCVQAAAHLPQEPGPSAAGARPIRVQAAAICGSGPAHLRQGRGPSAVAVPLRPSRRPATLRPTTEDLIESGGGTGPVKPRQPTGAARSSPARCQIRAGHPPAR